MSLCPWQHGFFYAAGSGFAEDDPANDPTLGFVYASYPMYGGPGYDYSGLAFGPTSSKDNVMYNNAFYASSTGAGDGYFPANSRNGVFDFCSNGGITGFQPSANSIARRFSPWTGGAYVKGLWNDIMTVPNSDSQVNTDFYVQAVVLFEEGSGTRTLFDHAQFSLTYDGTNLVFTDKVSDLDISVDVTSKITTGRWYSIAIAHDESANTAYLYLWNEVVGTKVGTSAFSSVADDTLYIGRTSTSTNYLQGLVEKLVVNGNMITTAQADEWWYERIRFASNDPNATYNVGGQLDYENNFNSGGSSFLGRSVYDYARIEKYLGNGMDLSANFLSEDRTNINGNITAGAGYYTSDILHESAPFEVNMYTNYPYFEFHVNVDSLSVGVGLITSSRSRQLYVYSSNLNNGTVLVGGLTTMRAGDVIGFAINWPTREVNVYINNVLIGSDTLAIDEWRIGLDVGITTGPYNVTLVTDPADWTYSAPTGHKPIAYPVPVNRLLDSASTAVSGPWSEIAAGTYEPERKHRYGYAPGFTYRECVMSMQPKNYWPVDSDIFTGTVRTNDVQPNLVSDGPTLAMSGYDNTTDKSVTGLLATQYKSGYDKGTGPAWADISPLTDFIGGTYVCWMNITETTLSSTRKYIMTLGGSASNIYTGLSLQVSLGKVHVIGWLNGSGGNYRIWTSTDVAIANDTPYMFVMQVTGNRITNEAGGIQPCRVWVNGTELSFSYDTGSGSTDITITYFSDEISFTRPRASSSAFTNGIVGHFATWNRELTQAEIDALWWHRGTLVEGSYVNPWGCNDWTDPLDGSNPPE